MLTVAFVLVFVFGLVVGAFAMCLAAISDRSERDMGYKR